MNNLESKDNYSFQKIVVVVGIILFIVKVTAWLMTDSVAIFTDAAESTINVLAGAFTLYSLFLSSKPQDRDHPYGHGKIEFISAGIEGGLISMAGVIIIYEAIINLFLPQKIGKLDIGILLITLTAIVNYLLGFYAIKKGEKNNSLALVAGGRHLQSDTVSTLGVVAGLIIIYFSHIYWLDSVIALFFGGVIIYTGIKIVREALAGIMDEADIKLIKKLVDTLEKNKSDNWIDIHNVRFIKYGSSLHLDCHLTIPWYFNMVEAEKETTQFEKIVKDNFGDKIEMFIHVDACESFSCKICNKKDCKLRKFPFEANVEWTTENIAIDKHHRIGS